MGFRVSVTIAFHHARSRGSNGGNWPVGAQAACQEGNACLGAESLSTPGHSQLQGSLSLGF